MNTQKLFRAAFSTMRKAGPHATSTVLIAAQSAMLEAIERSPLHVTGPEFCSMQRVIANAVRVMSLRQPGPVPYTLAQRLELARGGEIDFD